MWIKFVVDFRPCSEGFSMGTPEKQTIPNSMSSLIGDPPENKLGPLFSSCFGDVFVDHVCVRFVYELFSLNENHATQFEVHSFLMLVLRI